MTTTENYSLKLAEGGDIVNPLVIDKPNYETIDAVMKENADNGIPKATELTTGTVHALTRSNTDASVFHFTATSNFTTGDTFTVDNTQVTALLPSGLPLATGAYIIGSEVICALRDTLLTVFVSGGTALMAQDSERLGGELPSYYATDSDMTQAENSISALGLITTSLDDRVSALEGETISVTSDGVKTWGQLLTELYNLVDFSKISHRSVLLFGSGIYHIDTLATGDIRFERARIDSTARTINQTIIKVGTSSYNTSVVVGASTATMGDITNEIVASGSTIVIKY